MFNAQDVTRRLKFCQALCNFTDVSSNDKFRILSCTIGQWLPKLSLPLFSIIKPNRLMFFVEIMATYCEGHVKHKNKLRGQN
jgi:hypothetical protein